MTTYQELTKKQIIMKKKYGVVQGKNFYCYIHVLLGLQAYLMLLKDYVTYIVCRSCRKEKLQGLSKYIKELPPSKVSAVKHGSKLLDELVVVELEKEVETVKVSKLI